MAQIWRKLIGRVAFHVKRCPLDRSARFANFLEKMGWTGFWRVYYRAWRHVDDIHHWAFKIGTKYALQRYRKDYGRG